MIYDDYTTNVTSIQGGPPKKFGIILLYALTLSNINRFAKLFHCQNQKKICNNTITKIHHISCVILHYLVKCQVSYKQTENKTTSVTTHFKKITKETCLMSVLLSKITVTSCSFYIKCSMCPPCSWTVAVDPSSGQCLACCPCIMNRAAAGQRQLTWAVVINWP